MNVALPSGTAPRQYITKYAKFKGMDASTDPALVDNSRSPYAPNLISDSGGYPEKRLGWKTLFTFSGASVNGLYTLETASGVQYIAHVGSALYRFDGGGLTAGAPTAVSGAAISDRPSTGFVCRGALWILTGAEYLRYDGSSLVTAESIAYTPTLVISSPPAGGGTAFESVNLLTPKMRVSFLGTAGTTVYQLPHTEITSVDKVTVNGTELTSGYTANTTAGTVTFSTAPGAPAGAGNDNVQIEYSKTISGYADTIKKCRFAAPFGFDTVEGERIFFSGNPDKPNVDWHCESHDPDYLVDPAYIPDDSFALIGGEENPVMGYSRIGEYQAIVKGQSDQDATIYLRSCDLDSDGNMIYPLTQGAVGVGAVSSCSFGALGDEPLFLSSTGIYGIASTNVPAQYAIQNRSYYIDALLRKEQNLSGAVSVSWRGWYILCINSHCYVLDGTQNKSYKSQSGGEFVYECYYWDNVPAAHFLKTGSELYFGTADGRVCMFKTDDSKMTRYSDDGAAIKAEWSTKADDDGDFSTWKMIPLRGAAVLLKPHTRSSADVFVRTESDHELKIASANMNRFDFNDIDFESFSFETGDQPKIIPLSRKVKKYVSCQIIVRNTKPNEGFGVYGITKRFIRMRVVR